MSIHVKNINHIYRKGLPEESIALDDVSLNIDDNELVGIIGHTGSGKSTLVQHLNGLLKPSSGEILVDGVNLTDSKISMIDVRKKVGLVFQYPEYQLFEETVEKDISFGPKNLGLDEDEIRRRVEESMELVGLDYSEFSQKSPFDLSGGQKRRVAIAGVIAMKPKVLILDEPTAGLDPQTHQDILKMIKNIHKSEGNITIFISHNMNDIADICDKVVVMDDGKCLMMDTPKNVFAESEKLKSIGLDLPDITQLLLDLHGKRKEREGFRLGTSKDEEDADAVGNGVFSIDEAEEIIFNLIKGDVK